MVSLKNGTWLRTLAIGGLMAALAPTTALAKEPTMGSDKDAFNHAAKVTDAELDKMRGGFIDINGVLIDFNFFSSVQLNLDILKNVSVDTNNLTQAAMTATQIQDFLNPTIIQNIDNNTLITIQQALNLNIINAEQINNLAQMNQLSFQQSVQ